MFSEQVVVVVEIRRVSLISLALSSNSSLFLRLFSSRRGGTNARRAGKNHRYNDDSELEKHFSITKRKKDDDERRRKSSFISSSSSPKRQRTTNTSEYSRVSFRVVLKNFERKRRRRQRRRNPIRGGMDILPGKGVREQKETIRDHARVYRTIR